jgi:hypothetical protein
MAKNESINNRQHNAQLAPASRNGAQHQRSINGIGKRRRSGIAARWARMFAAAALRAFARTRGAGIVMTRRRDALNAIIVAGTASAKRQTAASAASLAMAIGVSA